LIFQLTVGCSDNGCIFCPAYKDKKFRVRKKGEVENEIVAASRAYPGTRRIFFADGDALAADTGMLAEILERSLKVFPRLNRVAIYGSVKSLENKSVEELRKLRGAKLGMVYLGFETGDEEVYKFIRKYGSTKDNVAACLKLKEAGIKVNVTVVLGLGGIRRSKDHALNTARLLNETKPHQIAALTLMVVPGTLIHKMAEKGEFALPDKYMMLEELRAIIENLEDFRCLFFSNHASNYFPVSARFPHEKEGVLKQLGRVIKNRRDDLLKPEILRDL
jgi:radical SAM superfamily enzyme YgiQ (UPF0313 family)